MSLPSGYTRLKYIRSTGAQAIFTGVAVDQDTRVVIDFQMTSGKTTEQHICSVRTSTSGPFFTAFYNGSLSSGNYRVRWASQAINTFKLISGTDRMVLDFNKNSVTLGDYQLTFSSATFSISYPLTLFCRNTAGTCDAYAYMDMYSCQIYSGTTLVRDYIPCKNSSGVAGLWDDVESMFYGSGTPLEAGPEDTSTGSHSTLINGTKYSIIGGRTLIGGTGYGISKGRTRVGGTGYDIAFGSAAQTETWVWDDVQSSLLSADGYTYDLMGEYGVTFESDGVTFTSIIRNENDMYYGEADGSETSVFTISIRFGTTWGNSGFKTITFSQPITEEMFDGKLLNLLQSSAVKQ